MHPALLYWSRKATVGILMRTWCWVIRSHGTGGSKVRRWPLLSMLLMILSLLLNSLALLMLRLGQVFPADSLTCCPSKSRLFCVLLRCQHRPLFATTVLTGTLILRLVGLQHWLHVSVLSCASVCVLLHAAVPSVLQGHCTLVTAHQWSHGLWIPLELWLQLGLRL